MWFFKGGGGGGEGLVRNVGGRVSVILVIFGGFGRCIVDGYIGWGGYFLICELMEWGG
jgi:hypothetical protein